MTKQLTNEQMLREWVQAGLDGKWMPQFHTLENWMEFRREDNQITVEYKEGVPIGFRWYTVACLINDDAFMKAVYKDKKICWGDCLGDGDYCDFIDDCQAAKKRYQHIQRTAIILNGDEQIKYLHSELGRGE